MIVKFSFDLEQQALSKHCRPRTDWRSTVVWLNTLQILYIISILQHQFKVSKVLGFLQYFTKDFKNIYTGLPYDVTVIQWITSCYKNRMTTRYLTLGYWCVTS